MNIVAVIMLALSFILVACDGENEKKSSAEEQKNIFSYVPDYLNNQKLLDLFEAPIVIGASVSAGQDLSGKPRKTYSPSFVATYQSSQWQGVNLTFPGKPSDSSLSALERYFQSGGSGSIILAADLFFWDSVDYAKKCSVALENVRKLFVMASAKKLKIVTADVPPFKSALGNPICLLRLNKRIDSMCKAYKIQGEKACSKIGLSWLFVEYMIRKELGEILQKDGLHLSPRGVGELAREIISATKKLN